MTVKDRLFLAIVLTRAYINFFCGTGMNEGHRMEFPQCLLLFGVDRDFESNGKSKNIDQ